MTKFLLLTFAMMSMITAFYLSWITKGRSWALSPLFLYVSCSIIFINIGYVFYFLHYLTESWAADALFSVSLGLFLIAVGGIVGGLMLRTSFIWSRIGYIQIREDIPYSLAVSTAFIVFAIVLLYFYFLGYIPILEGLYILLNNGFKRGLVNTLRVGRDVYVNPEAVYIPLQGFMEAMRYFGLPIVAVWFLHFYRQRIRRKMSLIIVVISSVLIVFTGQRWPLMYMFLTIIIYWSWTEPCPGHFRNFLIRIMFLAIIAGGVLSALLGRTLDSGLNTWDVLSFGFSDLWERIFLGNVKIPFVSYQLFSRHEDWLYGWTWLQDLLSYLPGPLPSYPVTFYKLVTGDPRGFTAPPDFYTEAYINFGWLGVIVFSIVWGMCLSFFQFYIARKKTGLFRISVLALMTTLIAFSAISGVMFLLSGIIVGIFIFLLLLVQKLVIKCIAIPRYVSNHSNKSF